jgi:predicted AlkP superfamily phosphohydrolase/phosphomutase
LVLWAAVAAVAMLGSAGPAQGYVGPGAGFAFAGSFLALFLALALGALVFITAPVRMVIRALRRRRARAAADCSRVVIVGLDGMSPVLAGRMIREGKLPNLAKLAERGTFKTLRSTTPSASPVAWSTFQTGTNPGKHGIFDFLSRDPRSYSIDLSSARVRPPRRTLKLGRVRIPLGKIRVRLLRKSQPFWKILGEHGIFSAVLRVPITFPPEKFHGVLLSGMCVPDLRGTQGSFTSFTTAREDGDKPAGGMRIPVQWVDGRITAAIPGPPNPLGPAREPLEIPFTVIPDAAGGSATLRLDGKTVQLRQGSYSPWVRLRFHAGPLVNVSGICRFYLSELTPEFRLYVTPIHIDPDRPALAISYPFSYAPYLAKRFGPYATLGLAEDTWALNERVISHEAFLEQAWSIHDEHEKAFFDALEKVREGMVAGVFDITDRAAHVFWHYTPEAKAMGGGGSDARYGHVLEDVYERMDEMIGRVMSKLREQDVLIVMSDHGFAAFDRCVNLNTWLKEHGFLTLKEGADAGESEYLAGVDWSRTQAYAFGLGGIYVNQMGREGIGIVQEGQEKEGIKRAIIEGLTGVKDREKGGVAVKSVLDGAGLYKGPYAGDGPDLVVGFTDGYRVSWECAVGKCSSSVFEDNEKAWSGDHCVDPEIVPGVFFSNRRITRKDPGIVDIAPSVLDVFGIGIPEYMDGKALFEAKSK